MTTIFTNLRAINGVVSTDKTVMQNLETLCTASGCWLTYDVNIGKWSVIINDPTFAGVVKSFDNSNILGGINVSGTGINELYNKVSVEFPHKDLRDEFDYVDLKVPDEQRFQNELDNTLNMQFDVINDPIQASYLGTVELNQSRLDKIIEFRTDYTALGLKAGDIIEVTSDVYGYTDKLFRVVRMTEDDAQGGELTLSITALEYDDSIFDTGLLEREERIKYTSIIPAEINEQVVNSNLTAAGNNSVNGLLTQAGLAALLSLINGMVGTGSPWGSAVRSGIPGAGGGNLAVRQSQSDTISPTITGTPPNVLGALTRFNEYRFTPPVTGVYGLSLEIGFATTNGAPSDQAFKAAFALIRQNGYHTGSLGDSTTFIKDTINAALGSSLNPLILELADYTGDQYTVLRAKVIGQLQAGVTYYVNTFVATGGNCNIIDSKIVEITYQEFNYQQTP
jgi:hypothetical protein